MTRQGKVQLWWFECTDHTHSGITYGLAGDGYGQRLGKTKNHEFVEFDFVEDSVVDEVVELADEVGMVQEYPKRSGCIEPLLVNICDPAPSGNRYDFSFKKSCPICGSSKVEYGRCEPPEFKTMNLPLATHKKWDCLNKEAKTRLVYDVLKKAGCLTD